MAILLKPQQIHKHKNSKINIAKHIDTVRTKISAVLVFLRHETISVCTRDACIWRGCIEFRTWHPPSLPAHMFSSTFNLSRFLSVLWIYMQMNIQHTITIIV